MLFVLVLIAFSVKGEYISFYEFARDGIEEFNSTQFKQYVLNSNRATIIEFYANWCNSSRSFINHWKEFANETRLWHRNVLRVASMDCGDNKNEICLVNDVRQYPQFRLYPAKGKNLMGLKKIESVESRSEQFMKTAVDFLEKQRHSPRHWPKLSPYT